MVVSRNFQSMNVPVVSLGTEEYMLRLEPDLMVWSEAMTQVSERIGVELEIGTEVDLTMVSAEFVWLTPSVMSKFGSKNESTNCWQSSVLSVRDVGKRCDWIFWFRGGGGISIQSQCSWGKDGWSLSSEGWGAQLSRWAHNLLEESWQSRSDQSLGSEIRHFQLRTRRENSPSTKNRAF